MRIKQKCFPILKLKMRWLMFSSTNMHIWKLICLMHYKDIVTLYLKFHSNYTWNLIHKIYTGYAQEAFFLFLENTLLSLLKLIFLHKKGNLFYIGPLMTLISLLNLIRIGLLIALKIFLFSKILKMAKCQLLFLFIRKILLA